MVAAANAIANDANDEKIDPGELKGRALDVIETQAGPAAWQRFVMRAATYAMEPQPPVDYVVEKLVTNSSVDVFFGEPGSKKTYSALSLAVCVANGKPWLGFATRQSPVLYLDEESGERRFTRRLGEALRGELCDEHSPIHYVCLASFKLDTSADPVIIQGLIEGVGARLVIFDALADLMDGDENDKADVQPVFNHLRKIAEATDSAVMVIHHAGKSGGYRGSSAIKGAVDLMVQIGSENGSNFVNFHSEKNRDGDKMSWAAEAVWTTDQFYLRAVDVREKTKPVSKSPEYVLRFLKKHGASAIPDIMAGADTCGAEGARKAVYSLADLKMLYRTNPGETGQGKAAIYDLTRTRPND